MLAVQRRRKARVGAPAAVAGAALVGLLAAGLGALGGRPEVSPGPSLGTGASDVAVHSPPGTASPSQPLQTPAVTPFRPCVALFDEVPEILLAVDEVYMPGQLALVSPGSDPTPDSRERPIEIAADATTSLWIGGDACAQAWHISLSATEADRLIPIELRSNPELDPDFASQNRFDLPLSQHRLQRGDLRLRAALVFPGMELVATWPIRFLPFERPFPRLLVAGEDRSFPTVEGCGILITFRNGSEEAHCVAAEVDPLPKAIRLEAGTQLQLTFDGWTVTDSRTTCRTPLPSRDPPDCWGEPQDDVQFAAPRAGDWIVETAACAVEGSTVDANRICGTWLVHVVTEVRQG